MINQPPPPPQPPLIDVLLVLLVLLILTMLGVTHRTAIDLPRDAQGTAPTPALLDIDFDGRMYWAENPCWDCTPTAAPAMWPWRIEPSGWN